VRNRLFFKLLGAFLVVIIAAAVIFDLLMWRLASFLAHGD